MLRSAPVALAVLAAATILPAASFATPTARQVDAIFAAYDRADAPGCALGVIRDGELAYARGYGMADLEHGIPLSAKSVFRIGSTSKQFTAAVMLLLHRDGIVDLDADVRTYLPELHAYPQPVTIRQMIHHTSGYRDYLELAWLAGLRDDDWYTDAEVVDLLARQRELNFPPGTDHLYSNSGFFLLSQVVRAATGKSLRQVASERIFGPLGMTHTHFHDDHTEIVPGRARGYAPRDDGGHRISMTTLDMVGDGGVFTSVEDLLQWDRAFYDGRLGAGFFDAMLETAILPDGTDTGYAFGLAVADDDGLRRVSHGGAFVGFRAEMMRYPERKLTVICLCNRADANPTRLATQVAELYLGRSPAAATDEASGPRPLILLSKENLVRRVGAYRRVDDDEPVWRIRAEEGRLLLEAGGDTFPLRPLSDRELAVEDAPADVVLAFDEGDGRTGLRVEIEGEARRYEPIELAAPDAATVAAIAGDYACEELATVIRVRPESGGLRVEHQNRFRTAPEAPLLPTLPDRFEGGGWTIDVKRDATGTADSLRLHAGRVRNLLCVRR